MLLNGKFDHRSNKQQLLGFLSHTPPWSTGYKRSLFNFYVPLAIRITLITRMIVGLIGMIFDSTSSNVIPTMDRMTMPMSRMFHLFNDVQKKKIKWRINITSIVDIWTLGIRWKRTCPSRRAEVPEPTFSSRTPIWTRRWKNNWIFLTRKSEPVKRIIWICIGCVKI